MVVMIKMGIYGLAIIGVALIFYFIDRMILGGKGKAAWLGMFLVLFKGTITSGTQMPYFQMNIVFNLVFLSITVSSGARMYKRHEKGSIRGKVRDFKCKVKCNGICNGICKK